MKSRRINCQTIVIFLSACSVVIGQDIISTISPEQVEQNELYNQSDAYLREMEEIFKNESKILFKEHVQHFRLEMENEITKVEKFIVNEYDTMIDAINNTENSSRNVMNETKAKIIEKLRNAKLKAVESYQEIKNKFHSIVDNIENSNHTFGKQVFDHIKNLFHEIAVLVRLAKKDPAIPDDEQQREQQQYLQQMPIVNYFPQLANVG